MSNLGYLFDLTDEVYNVPLLPSPTSVYLFRREEFLLRRDCIKTQLCYATNKKSWCISHPHVRSPMIKYLVTSWIKSINLISEKIQFYKFRTLIPSVRRSLLLRIWVTITEYSFQETHRKSLQPLRPWTLIFIFKGGLEVMMFWLSRFTFYTLENDSIVYIYCIYIFYYVYILYIVNSVT